MVGFFTPDVNEVPPDAPHNPIDMQNSPAGSFGEIAQASFDKGLVPSYMRYMYEQGQETRNTYIDPQPNMSPQDIKQSYDIDVPKPMPEFQAQYIADAQQREKTYQMAAQNANGIKRFGADTVAFLADPINLGSLFIPYVGEERVAAGLGALGLDASTQAGMAATRSVTMAGAGAISQAPLSALTYGLDKTKMVDYGIADALKDTLFAGAVGGMAGPLFGAVGDAILGKPEWARQIQSTKFSDNQTTAQVGLSQMAKENPVDVQPIRDITYSNDFRQKQTNMLYSAEDAESYRSKNADIIGQEKFYEPQSNDQDILKSMESLPQRMADVNERLSDTSLPPDWRKVLEGYRDKLSTLSDRNTEYQALHLNEMKLAEWRGEAPATNRDIPPVPAAKEVQQFVEEQHGNGTLGLSPQEITPIQDAANEAVHTAHVEPDVEVASLTQHADELEQKLRDQSGEAAMAEHDAWKKQQETLTEAHAKLQDCLME